MAVRPRFSLTVNGPACPENDRRAEARPFAAGGTSTASLRIAAEPALTTVGRRLPCRRVASARTPRGACVRKAVPSGASAAAPSQQPGHRAALADSWSRSSRVKMETIPKANPNRPRVDPKMSRVQSWPVDGRQAWAEESALARRLLRPAAASTAHRLARQSFFAPTTKCARDSVVSCGAERRRMHTTSPDPQSASSPQATLLAPPQCTGRSRSSARAGLARREGASKLRPVCSP